MFKQLAINGYNFRGSHSIMLNRKLKLPLTFMCMKRTSVCVFKREKSLGNRVPWGGISL